MLSNVLARYRLTEAHTKGSGNWPHFRTTSIMQTKSRTKLNTIELLSNWPY